MKRYLVGVGILGSLEISLVLYLTHWREIFWNLVAAKDLHGFILYLGIFTVVALSLCVITATATYFSTLAAIEWRKRLNSKAMKLKLTKIENVNQRIQEDCREYPFLVLNIGVGIIKAIVFLIVFSIALSVTYSVIYLVIISSYAIVSTYVAKKIGNPLISLNYKAQQVEATYRNALSSPNFRNCLEVQFNLARRLKYLQYFQTLYGQLGVVVPLIIIAPAYFSTSMTLGGLMQANSIMSTITDNLSYGINNFDVFNRLLSCRKRLGELGVL